MTASPLPPRRRLRLVAPWLVADGRRGRRCHRADAAPSQASAPLRNHAAAINKFVGYAANASLLCNNSATCTSGNDATYRNHRGDRVQPGHPRERAEVGGHRAVEQQLVQLHPGRRRHRVRPGQQPDRARPHAGVAQPDARLGAGPGRHRDADRDAGAHRHRGRPVRQQPGAAVLGRRQRGHRRRTAQLRTSFWFNTLGESYIADAFRFARAADPATPTLCINDYSIEGIDAEVQRAVHAGAALLSAERAGDLRGLPGAPRAQPDARRLRSRTCSGSPTSGLRSGSPSWTSASRSRPTTPNCSSRPATTRPSSTPAAP